MILMTSFSPVLSKKAPARLDTDLGLRMTEKKLLFLASTRLDKQAQRRRVLSFGHQQLTPGVFVLRMASHGGRRSIAASRRCFVRRQRAGHHRHHVDGLTRDYTSSCPFMSIKTVRENIQSRVFWGFAASPPAAPALFCSVASTHALPNLPGKTEVREVSTSWSMYEVFSLSSKCSVPKHQFQDSEGIHAHVYQPHKGSQGITSKQGQTK